MDIGTKSIEELEDLAKQIREKIIDVVSKNGGHLGSNLGMVELAITLHYVYDSPKDKFIWDVGHQTYAHKILTNRLDRFDTIRKKDGLSPFSDPYESEHDHFVSGHAGNAISAAEGFAMTTDRDVIAIIGDGAFGNGTTFEALNEIAGKLKNLTIIINDNEMSIGENVGGISNIFNRIFTSSHYLKLKGGTRELLNKKGFNKSVVRPIEKLENSVRGLTSAASIFGVFGYDYIGPIDGHDIENLIRILSSNKKEKTRVIHIKTQKGKGYQPAIDDPESYHGVSPFNSKTGEISKSNSKIYSDLFGEKIIELMDKDEEVLAFTAGMLKGTSLKAAKEKHKDRVIDTGMTEGHTVTLAASLVRSGKKPYVAIYSTFLQRAYSHILHDVAIYKEPVRFIIDRAGVVPDDGKTHQGVYDIAYLLTVPDVDIVAPTTKDEFEEALDFSLDITKPLAIRFPKDEIYEYKQEPLKYGKWNEVVTGKETIIIATGAMFKEVMLIKDELISKINPTIVSAAWIKPFDEKYIMENLKSYKKLFILEDGIIKSGFGTEILEFISDNDIDIKVIRIGLDQKQISHAKRKEILEDEGLEGKNLLDRLLN